VVLFNR